MRILIAEDDPVSRLLLDATLKKWKYETVVCCDGREALAQLEGDAPPEIAILDWMMPEVDGLDVPPHPAKAQSHSRVHHAAYRQRPA